MTATVIGLGFKGPNLVRHLYGERMRDGVIICDKDPHNMDRPKDKYPALEFENNDNNLLNCIDEDAVVIAHRFQLSFPLARSTVIW